MPKLYEKGLSTSQLYLLKDITRYRRVTLAHLLQLGQWREKREGKPLNEHHTRDLLHDIAQKGYIIELHHGPDDATGLIKHPYSYRLLPEGKTYLFEYEDVVVPYNPRKANDLQDTTTRPFHTLAINTILIHALVLSHQYPDRIELEELITEGEMSRYVKTTDGGVQPDGYLRILALQPNGRWRIYNLFLEYERTTGEVSMSKFQERIFSYLLFFEHTMRNRFNISVDEDGRLLIVTPSDTATKRLIRWTKKKLEELNRIESDADRFLLTTLDAKLSPLQFYCSERWYIPDEESETAVSLIEGQEDLLQSS